MAGARHYPNPHDHACRDIKPREFAAVHPNPQGNGVFREGYASTGEADWNIPGPEQLADLTEAAREKILPKPRTFLYGPGVNRQQLHPVA